MGIVCGVLSTSAWQINGRNFFVGINYVVGGQIGGGGGPTSTDMSEDMAASLLLVEKLMVGFIVWPIPSPSSNSNSSAFLVPTHCLMKLSVVLLIKMRNSASDLTRKNGMVELEPMNGMKQEQLSFEDIQVSHLSV